jgi:hypothetical protein
LARLTAATRWRETSGAASLLFKCPAIPTKAFGKGPRVIGLGEAEHHEVVVIAAMEYMSGAADRATAALNVTSLVSRPRTFSAVHG